MKKILTLLALSTCAYFSTNAQRTVDLSIRSLIPVDGMNHPNLATGDTFKVMYEVKNAGPDSIISTDSLYLRFGGFLTTSSGTGSYIITSNMGAVTIAPGATDTFLFTTTQGYNWGSTADGTVSSFFPTNNYDTLTLQVIARDSAGNLLIEPDFTENTDGTYTIGANNRDTVEFIFGTIPTSIAGNNLSKNISIFPNPASNTLNVDVYLNEIANTTIRVYDISGKEVLRNDLGELVIGSHQISVDIKNLPNGFYSLELSAGINKGVTKFSIRK